MCETRHEVECLRKILTAAQAYREGGSSEDADAVLMQTLKVQLMEQRHRYDKLVHARASKVRHVTNRLGVKRKKVGNYRSESVTGA